MKKQNIKTGDVFYYDTPTLDINKTHCHKCRVLFVGTENLFYDAWWEGIDKWSYVPVSKRLIFYRWPLNQLDKLTFQGSDPLDAKSADKLFLRSPEIILSIAKKDLKEGGQQNTFIQAFSEKIAFIPVGPKRGFLRPVFLDSSSLTLEVLTNFICEFQDLDFIFSDEIILERVGLHGGFPSYCIRYHR